MIVELPTLGLNMKALFEMVEIDLIEQAMARTNQNCHLAAKLLGLNRSALVMKRKKYGMLQTTGLKRGRKCPTKS